MYPPRPLSKKMVKILKSSETNFFFPQLCLLDPDQQLGIHSFLTPKGMGKKGRAKAREKSLVRIKCLMSERKRDEQKKSHAKPSSPPTSRLVSSQFPSNCCHGRASHQLFTAEHDVVWHSIPPSSGQLSSCPPSAC